MDVLLRLVIVVAVVVGVTVVGRLARARDGRFRRVAPAPPAATAVPTSRPGPRLEADDQARVGLDPAADGPRAVLFGSPTCRPCDTVKAVLDDVRASERPDLQWAYVDAAEHLDLADAHRVRRVPTLLVVGPDGTVVSRASGVPSRGELLAALAA